MNKSFLQGVKHGIPIALGYPAGWILCSTIILIYYRSGAWMRKYRLSPA